MKIGNLKLDNSVFLAPMASITDLPYRVMMKRSGAGLVFSEMVSAKGLIYSGPRTRELLFSVPEERPLAVQLFGSDPEILSEAAKSVHEVSDLIDLNLGCPVNKVVRSGAGSALLKEPLKVKSILRALRAATDLPLTIKIRSGWDLQSVNFLEIGRIAEGEGIDAVTLHPRTRNQGFSGHSDWEQIRQLKDEVNIPVIGSGDIHTPQDAVKMMLDTGCDAIMIGRASYGNPWLIRDCVRLLGGAPTLPPPPLRERELAALTHLELQVEFFGERKALYEMRKHFCWYVRGLEGASQFRAAINKVGTLTEQRTLLEKFFISISSDVDNENVA